MSNAIICEVCETCFFYCWIQLPAVVVWLVFWLALSPSEDKVVAWKSQAVVRLRRNHCSKCFAKRFPIWSGIRCGVCILLPWSKSPQLWPHFFFLPTPLLSIHFRCWFACKGHHEWLHQGQLHAGHDEQVICHLVGICPWISADGNARIHIFERRHGHEPMEIGRHVPVLDAVSKQTNRYHSLPNRWQSPEMWHIRLLSAGLLAARTAWNTCCRRVTSLKPWVGEMIPNWFPKSRNMFNEQI